MTPDAELTALRTQLQAAEAENVRLREWQQAILGNMKVFPEYNSLPWGGDKEGWGFVFELINYKRKQNADLEAKLAGAVDMLERNAKYLRFSALTNEDELLSQDVAAFLADPDLTRARLA